MSQVLREVIVLLIDATKKKKKAKANYKRQAERTTIQNDE